MHLKKIKFISLLFILVLSSCGDSVVSKTIYPFSTYLTMNFYNENNVDIDYIEDLINEYDKLADPYNSYEGINNVYTINNSSDFIEVDTKLYDLIKYSEDMRIKTSGYFNPLIGNLSLTWKNAIENKALPNEEIISQELEEIANSSLEFSDGKIKINGEANIDLGAITKGYVLNVLKDYLKENNISKYLINGGNSSIILGNKNGGDFKIGINNLSMGFKAKEISIGTSSVDEQNFTLDNIIYSHIINPFTGSAISKHETIIVMNDNAALMDVYSTVFMMLDLEDIKSICADNDFKVIVIDNKQITYKDSEIELYV